MLINSKRLVVEYVKTIGKFTYDERDCITSIWRILEQHGAKTDLVGSNWFARHELVNMRPLTNKKQLFDGCAVLKTVKPGESGYSLPNRYADHIDQIDYNHIGIGTDDGHILDSTRYGQKPDGTWTRNGPGWSEARIAPNSWDIIAEFPPDMVDYSDRSHAPDYKLPKVVPVEIAIVRAKSGNTVRMRKTPSVRDITIANIPVGSSVGVLSKQADWWQIAYAGKTGWMMAEFLRPGDAQGGTAPPDDIITINIPKSAAQALFDSLKSVLDA